MDAKFLIIGGGLAALALYLFRRKNEEQTNARRADTVTEDLTVSENKQAAQLYNILKPNKFLGLDWTTNNYKNSPAGAAKVLNVLLEVTDWKSVQEAFRKLCNNELTLNNALSNALSTEAYKIALDIAAAKKVVTTQDVTVTINDPESMYGIITKNFKKNTLLGALKSTQALSYRFINYYTEKRNVIGLMPELVEVTGDIQQSLSKLV